MVRYRFKGATCHAWSVCHCHLAAAFADNGKVSIALGLIEGVPAQRKKIHSKEDNDRVDDHLCDAWSSITESLTKSGRKTEASELTRGFDEPFVQAAMWLGMATPSAEKDDDEATRCIERAVSIARTLDDTRQQNQISEWANHEIRRREA